jgi:hypothetical protein
MQARPDRIPAERLINAGLAVGYAIAILFAAAPAGAKNRTGLAAPARLSAKADLSKNPSSRWAKPVRWAANP